MNTHNSNELPINRIYALVDPRTDEVRYIGVTTQRLSTRLLAHVSTVDREKHTRKIAWIKSLLCLGLKPSIWLIEETTDRSRECYWIAQYRNEGARLTNGTNGGDGGAPMLGKHHSAETRTKMSLAAKTSPKAIQARAIVQRKSKGRTMSPEQRAKISATLKSIQTDEMRRQNSERQKGSKQPEEVIRKRAATLKAVWAAKKK